MKNELPTDKVLDAAEQAVREPEQEPEGRRFSDQHKDDRFKQEPPIETINHLYGKLFFGDGKSQYVEINKHTPSGYLTEDEIRWMHGLQDIQRHLAILEDQYNIPVGPTGHFFQRKLDFITMVSKSRRGFAIKETGTSRVESDESVFHETADDEDKGLFATLSDKLQGNNLAEQQVIGKPQHDSYVGGGNNGKFGTWGRRRSWD